MGVKIAVITGSQVRGRVEAALQRIKPPCEIVMADYEDFSQISRVYDQYAGEVDGFLVSGEVAQEAIERMGHTLRRPVLTFQSDPGEIYRAVLVYLLEHPEGSAKRVVLDFLLPLGEAYTAEAFVRQKQLEALDGRVDQWRRGMTWEELRDVEENIAGKLVDMWERGEMDMVICLYSSIIPVLERNGIPFKYPILSDVSLRELIRQLLVRVELERLRSSLPAAVSVAPRHRERAGEEERRRLRETLDGFLRENLLECVVQEEAGCCNILTTVEVMHYLTDRCQTSRLSAYLEQQLKGVPAAVGYGVGGSPNHALLNARIARKESESSGWAFIRNEAGDLIGPLGTERRMVVESQSVRGVGELAKRCGLASLTIQKVAASAKLAGSDKMTTQELAKRLGVTVRNANRILSRLEAGGGARVVYTQTAQSKGRPVKVYELTLE